MLFLIPFQVPYLICTRKRCSYRKKMLNFDLKQSASTFRIKSVYIGSIFQGHEEGDQLRSFMVRGPSSYIYHIWTSTIKIYLSIYGCRRSSTKEKVRYFSFVLLLFLLKRNEKAAPTLYCCNIIDPITYFIRMIWIIWIYLVISNHSIFIKIKCFHCFHWPF